jgi:hypothetical protein
MGGRVMCNWSPPVLREWYRYSKLSSDFIILCPPLSVGPFERYDRVKALTWLQRSPRCNEQISPAVDTVLDGSMYLVHLLILCQVNMQ